MPAGINLPVSAQYTALVVALLVLAWAESAHSQTALSRILGVGPPPVEANSLLRDAAVSPDGGHILFTTSATNVASVFSVALNVYRYDVISGAIEIVSRNATTGVAADGNCFLPSASTDGRFVVFESLAANLGPTGSALNIYRADMATGAIVRASQSQSGTEGNDQSRFPAVSGSGRFAVFQSFANNLVAVDNNSRADIFLTDIDTGAVEVISRDATGAFANDNAGALTNQAISTDARYVVFPSLSANMVTNVAGGIQQIYLRDRVNATTSLVSQSVSAVPGGSQSDQAAISSNGRFIVFRSFANNLIVGATSRLFILDRQTSVLAAVPLPLGSAFSPPLSASALSCRSPRVADSGDVVMICDMAAPTPAQAILWKRSSAGQLELLSHAAGSASTFGNVLSGSLVGISSAGSTITFESQAGNLVTGDGNSVADVFYRAPAVPPGSLFSNGFE